MNQLPGHKELKTVSDGMRTILPYTQLGWQIVVTIGMFFAIGYGLDAWIGIFPWLTVAFSVIGIVAALVTFVKTAEKLQADNSRGKQ